MLFAILSTLQVILHPEYVLTVCPFLPVEDFVGLVVTISCLHSCVGRLERCKPFPSGHYEQVAMPVDVRKLHHMLKKIKLIGGFAGAGDPGDGPCDRHEEGGGEDLREDWIHLRPHPPS